MVVSRILLIRHADAGDPDRWSGDDSKRPLTDKGRRQAQGLVGLLDEERLAAVFSSPSVRCRETVSPLAEARRVAVGVAPQLAEGADPQAALAWLAQQGHAAGCSHGDVVQGILASLMERGVDLGETRMQKAGTWILDVAGEAVSAARYLPPPSV